jgi:hypothetical protein
MDWPIPKYIPPLAVENSDEKPKNVKLFWGRLKVKTK